MLILKVKTFNLILYLFNEDCQGPMATSGFPSNILLFNNKLLDSQIGHRFHNLERSDNMKQPVAILVLPVFYENLPVSAILVNTSFPVSSRIFQYLQY